ncbi:cytochrome P450 94A1-like [Salvia miltiorrhiza]|uniref:cytochrome P450 94A1-like n=1 Tax=Salvia miltiorrhiza TaxID=226208 RepID=UPI0025AD6D05|nr:cytochrome P450 94A1-like [Salvia miltiorrhiza]
MICSHTASTKMDFNFNLSTSVLLCILILPLSLLIILAKLKKTASTKLPKSYPILGSFFTIVKNKERFVQWTSEIVTSTPNLTFLLHRSPGSRVVITANPANVQHILKNNFSNYEKGEFSKAGMRDFLGHGIFNSDGPTWKFQRQVASHEFNTKSLRKFVETVVDSELSQRLIPILRRAAAEHAVVDFQDILQRFAFDNVCKIAFGYDPGYLSPSHPKEINFAAAFETAVKLSSERFASFTPLIWKIKRAFNVGSQKQLKIAVREVRDFAKEIIRGKKQELEQKSALESVDLLSRFLSSGHSDEDFITDIVISFILAGRDTTSAALTWFFWLLSDHAEVEDEILREISETSETASAYDEVKDMVYTHASICESMRLYPPVPVDGREALSDDVLPDGTVVKKGMRVAYHPYAMGRVEKVWGKDWAEFRPARWLEGGRFVNRDAFTYPVFQAGPRICLGKEMAFLQMKRVIAGVLQHFRVVPELEAEPVYITDLTAKMKGGFPVRIQERNS